MGDRLIEKLYFGFLILLPLVYFGSIIDPVLIPRQILLSAFLLLVVLVLVFQKRALEFPFKTTFFYAVAGFLVFNYISFFQSTLAGESHAVFAKLALIVSLLLLTTALLLNNIIKPNQLVLAVIIFGLIIVAFPIIELIQKNARGQHLLRQIEAIKGSSANKNLLSSILFLCLPFYFMGIQMVKKAIRFLSYAGLLTTLFVLITIRTRAVLIACALFFILLTGYKIKRRFAIKTKYFIGAGIVSVLLFVSVAIFYFKTTTVESDFSATSATQKYWYRLLDSRTLESRIQFWNNSMQMAKEHPLMGVGLGNWQIQFPKYGLNQFTEYHIVNGEETLQRPHNDFIWILCETGILGLLAYMLLFGVIFYQLILLIKRSITTEEKWKYYFIFSALIGYLVISFFDFPYERIEHQVIIMLLFAIVASEYLKTVAKTKTKPNSLFLILLIPISYSLLVSFYRFSGEQHAKKMYLAKINKNWSETIYESQKADSYFYRIDNTSMPLTWYEGIAHFNEGRLDDSQACFEKAYQLTPYNIQVITNLASTYQASGKIDEAAALFNQALKISTQFDEAKLNLAALYFNKKEYDKAYTTINEVKIDTKNPKYKTYLVPILNQKINAYLKTAKDKVVVGNLVRNVTTKEALLQLFFDAKKQNMAFEDYLAKAKF